MYSFLLLWVLISLQPAIVLLLMDWFMVFNATFNNISGIFWQSVLLMEETRVPRKNHWPAASPWQTLSHNVVSSTPRHEWDLNGRRGPDLTLVWFASIYVISANQHLGCAFKSHSCRGVLDTTLCDKVCNLILRKNRIVKH
jgi:hypothetical protein